MHYADIAVDNKLQEEAVNKFWEGEEIAVIAFWDQNEGGNFSCSRHFYVPNPKKRAVREVAGKELYEVLYLS